MQDIVIRWPGQIPSLPGEMHLTPLFFTQGTTKVRKAFKLLLQDDNWNEARVRELAGDLVIFASTLDENARNQHNFAEAFRESAQVYKKEWRRGKPLPPQYHHDMKSAAREEQTGKQFHEQAENVRKASSLLLEMWESKHD